MKGGFVLSHVAFTITLHLEAQSLLDNAALPAFGHESLR